MRRIRHPRNTSAQAETHQWCPGPDSNRQAVRRRIFVTLRLSTPALQLSAASPFVRWTMPSPSRGPSIVDAPRRIRRPPSSLYTFRSACRSDTHRAWLGVASATAPNEQVQHTRGFAEFEGFCTDRFQPGTQCFKSAMFTNFITRAGRTRFYHWRSPTHAPARGVKMVALEKRAADEKHPNRTASLAAPCHAIFGERLCAL